MSNSSPVQPQLLSRINESLVLRTIRQQGPSTRGELAQHMGVTFPTVAKAVGSLIDASLVEEFDDAMTGPGRPAKRLRLSRETSQVVGVTVDVEHCEVAAAGFDGVLREDSRQSFSTPRSYDELLAAIAQRVGTLQSDHAPILCIGLSVVGLVDYRRQEIRLAANLPFLDGKTIGLDLNRCLATDCVLVHDAHALCLAEYVYGQARDLDSFVVLDMCTGIGMGVMVNHTFLTGYSGFAGEMGHIPIVPNGRKCRCGRRGCLETVASEWALVTRVSERLGKVVSFEEIISLALARDKFVRSELNRLCKYLAMAMAHVVNLFDPQCVFVNGRLFEELPWLCEHVVSRAKQLALEPAFEDCRFLPATGSHLLGAVATAINAVTSSRLHELRETLRHNVQHAAAVGRLEKRASAGATMNIHRRNFLKSAAATAALSAFPTLSASAQDVLNGKTRRVALIGAGWYGPSDLWRLIQVAPVEVVAICDPDKNMLRSAVEIASQRQKSHNKPATYNDYRDMFKQHEPEIVLVGSPDHWHALHAIAAIEAGADVYLQKPISVDVLEGEAILAAARKHNRVVQIGTQRKSTPHLIEAKKQVVDAGLLGTIGHVEMCCYYHMRANGNPPVEPVPDFLDYEMWTGPAPLRPYDGIPHRRWWRTFMEYGNGIVGDMCVHMFDTARWMLKLGWPNRISSDGGIFVQKDGKSNISDTQTATFEYDGFNAVWQHRTWGTPPDPDYPWALFIYGDKGTLKASTMRADFAPHGSAAKSIHFECVFEREKYPEDLTERDIELNAAPATRRHMLDFLTAIDQRSRPVADVEDGHISTASCILANVAMKLGRPLVYDPEQKQVVGDAEATKLLARPYRAPWKRPQIA